MKLSGHFPGKWKLVHGVDKYWALPGDFVTIHHYNLCNFYSLGFGKDKTNGNPRQNTPENGFLQQTRKAASHSEAVPRGWQLFPWQRQKPLTSGHQQENISHGKYTKPGAQSSSLKSSC